MTGLNRRLFLAAWFGASLVAPSPALGQAVGVPPADSSFVEAPTPRAPASPGGAFLRSLLLPGWGHAAVGAYSRGAFYFAAAAGTGYMMFKSTANRAGARRVLDARTQVVEAELQLAGRPADSIPLLVAEDERVQEAQALVDTRSQQVQDWAALGIFVVLLSGADAFVSAHLMDFPEPLQVNVTPGAFGRVEVGVRFPYPGPGG